MTIEHRLLTGASLHEPKGVETATADQVYAANGSGSGSWVSRLSGVVNINKVIMSGTIPDVSTTNSSFFLYIPAKLILTRVSCVETGTLITANSILTIYKNGVAQTPTITIPFSGSGAGVVVNAAISPTITFNDGDTFELRSNGGTDNTSPLSVSVTFTAST